MWMVSRGDEDHREGGEMNGISLLMGERVERERERQGMLMSIDSEV